MDIQKERQAFEKVIEDMGLSTTKVCANEVYTTQKVRDMWAGWQAAKAQAVPEGFVLVEKSKIESWYLDEYEGMYTDEPDNFLHDLEIGSVQAVKRKDYLIINEQTLYAACPWNKNDETADCWKFYESKAEADLVAENCIKNWNDGDSQEPSHD
ncbi:hypothetical protein G9F32_02925 [Acinetobacter sp. 194]|uniref:hypothetical protein n=1 Tax=Acinetobacter shaoyimingii TaxID=2715164 RepID=UPI00140E3E3E|nr:hypothetical protein [Acinetobacter shaoyimingii]NHB56988.1 hypothetical protein [Acinetobacter shaoyimingii]